MNFKNSSGTTGRNQRGMDSQRARLLPLEAERVMAVEDDAVAGSSMSTVGAGEPRTVSAHGVWSASSVAAIVIKNRTHRHR